MTVVGTVSIYETYTHKHGDPTFRNRDKLLSS